MVPVFIAGILLANKDAHPDPNLGIESSFKRALPDYASPPLPSLSPSRFRGGGVRPHGLYPSETPYSHHHETSCLSRTAGLIRHLPEQVAVVTLGVCVFNFAAPAKQATGRD